jgi:hypothetical protein
MLKLGEVPRFIYKIKVPTWTAGTVNNLQLYLPHVGSVP